MADRRGEEPENRCRKIMIVDDDAAVTNYLLVFLTQTGRFDITIVNDSRAVGPLLDGGTFDIMLLDIDMPFIDGLEILRKIREKGLSLPVIVLTGVADVDLAVKSMKFGAFDYLVKPVEEERLLEVLDASTGQDRSTATHMP